MARYNPKERIGVQKFVSLVEEHSDWIFQGAPTVDVGIDAIVEQTVNGDTNGALIACKIKSGNGNFSTTKDGKLVYSISHIYREYWVNHDLPNILILVDDNGLIYWQVLNHNTIKKAKIRFKTEIPKHQKLRQENINDVFEKALHNKKLSKLMLSEANDLDIIIEDIIDSNDLMNALQNISDYCDNYTNYTEATSLKIEKNMNTKKLSRLMSKYASQGNLLAKRVENESEVFVEEASGILTSMRKLINHPNIVGLTFGQFQIILDSIDLVHKKVIEMQGGTMMLIDIFKNRNSKSFKQVKKANALLLIVFTLFEQETSDVNFLVKSVKETLKTIKPKH